MGSTNWHNNDELFIKFGTNEATPATGGEHRYDGLTHQIELNIADLTTLADANAIIDSNIKLPDGALLNKVTIITTTAATGSSATLHLGVIDEDRASNGDPDAIIAAAPVTDFAAIGDTVTYTQGSDEHGALIGTVLTKSLYITAGYETAAFTAGGLKIILEYFMTE